MQPLSRLYSPRTPGTRYFVLSAIPAPVGISRGSQLNVLGFSVVYLCVFFFYAVILRQWVQLLLVVFLIRTTPPICAPTRLPMFFIFGRRWIHHLARHAVACFLTRGDLWQSWEDGAAVFDELLLDADWSINNFNWQWLSCSAFFYQVSCRWRLEKRKKPRWWLTRAFNEPVQPQESSCCAAFLSEDPCSSSLCMRPSTIDSKRLATHLDYRPPHLVTLNDFVGRLQPPDNH